MHSCTSFPPLGTGHSGVGKSGRRADSDQGLAQAAQHGMDFGDQLTGRLDKGTSDSIFELVTLI